MTYEFESWILSRLIGTSDQQEQNLSCSKSAGESKYRSQFTNRNFC